MKTFTTAAALLSAVSAVLAQSGGAIIQSPASLVQCQPVLLSWSGGQAPYYISVIPGGQASAPAIKTFPVQESGTSLTWIVDLGVQEISLKIVDGSGVPNYSSPIPIQAGGDTACLNGGAAPATTAAATSTTPSTRPATTPATSSTTVESRPASSSSMTTSVRPASSSSSSASSGTSSGPSSSASGIPPAAASPTTPTGGAGKLVVNAVGLAGVAGLVALLA